MVMALILCDRIHFGFSLAIQGIGGEKNFSVLGFAPLSQIFDCLLLGSIKDALGGCPGNRQSGIRSRLLTQVIKKMPEESIGST